jgi:hypothetical protein
MSRAGPPVARRALVRALTEKTRARAGTARQGSAVLRTGRPPGSPVIVNQGRITSATVNQTMISQTMISQAVISRAPRDRPPFDQAPTVRVVPTPRAIVAPAGLMTNLSILIRTWASASPDDCGYCQQGSAGRVMAAHESAATLTATDVLDLLRAGTAPRAFCANAAPTFSAAFFPAMNAWSEL